MSETRAVPQPALFKPFNLSGTGLAWNLAPVAYHGDWHDYVYPGRLALAGQWPAPSPEQCHDTTGQRTWVANGLILACPGCGLDCT